MASLVALVALRVFRSPSTSSTSFSLRFSLPKLSFNYMKQRRLWEPPIELLRESKCSLLPQSTVHWRPPYLTKPPPRLAV
uniref:Putative secreted protein n=1 Tax=Anopheles triannulatus TaxID=58253 RepID=A0A2M4B3H4_9DIPT